MLLRLALGIVCLVSCLPCQRGGEGEEEGRIEEATRQRNKQQGRGEKGEKVEGGDAERPDEMANLTPEQRLARNITNGASAHCRFLATVKPAKLMPGQSGTVIVTALLQGHAVIPSPAPLELLAAQQQGPVAVGGLTVRPADAGRLEPGYLGRPVYENFAVLEVPVTMGPEAEIGKKHVVALDMKFDLYDGNSAQPIGRFVDRVSTEIEVGKALDPAVVRSGRATEPRTADAPATNEPSTTPPANRDATTAQPVRGSQPLVVPERPSEVLPERTSVPSGPADLPDLDTEDGIPLPILVGAGVVAIGLVLLLARKK